MEDIITAEDILYTAGGHTVLDGISLSIPPGETTVIMGPSGCGKSTFLKIMAGITLPQEGKVSFEGISLSSMNEKTNLNFRSRMGFLFQDAALWANKNIFQNIELPLRFHNPGLTQEEVKKKIDGWVKRLRFEDELQQRPSNLSSGEQKIASFIRAMITDPELVFLDDPTAFVDSQNASRITGVMEDLKRQKKTMIIVTQEPKLTAKIADNIVVMKEGRILESGPFSDVVRSQDPDVMEILTDVLSQAASYSGDILDLLSSQGESTIFGDEES